MKNISIRFILHDRKMIRKKSLKYMKANILENASSNRFCPMKTIKMAETKANSSKCLQCAPITDDTHTVIVC